MPILRGFDNLDPKMFTSKLRSSRTQDFCGTLKIGCSHWLERRPTKLYCDTTGCTKDLVQERKISLTFMDNDPNTESGGTFCIYIRMYAFTARRSYTSAVWGVVILYVCPRHARFVTKQQCSAYILIPTRKGNLVFRHQKCLVARRHFCPNFALKLTHPFKIRRLWQISA